MNTNSLLPIALLGLGQALAPVICQTIIARGVAWPYFYFGSLAIVGLNVVFLVISFIPTPNELKNERHIFTSHGKDQTFDITKGEKAPEPVTNPTELKSSEYHRLLTSMLVQRVVTRFLTFFDLNSTWTRLVTSSSMGYKHPGCRVLRNVSFRFNQPFHIQH